jgi:threonine dehydratase
MIALADLEDAERRLTGVLRQHPCETSSSLSELVGRPIFIKPEHLQRTGSFKIRGAYNRISRIAEAKSATEVVAGSAGNHAQGVALAARLAGLKATIFMPQGASLPKLEATRQYGAEVHAGGTSVEDSIAAALEYARATGAIYVPPFDDVMVIAGQGTIGLEIAREAPDAEVVVVPVGGGGLISGIAAAIKLTRPTIRVVGVEAVGAAALVAALESGAPVTLAAVRTMADGIAVKAVSPLTYEHCVAYVDEVVTVTEEEISQAMLVLLERSKWVVEPAGAAGFAALLAKKISGDGPAVALLSGGNVDPLLLRRLIDHGLSAAGRYLRLRVILDDHPGSLARLTASVAAQDLNVLDVDHHRSGAGAGLAEVEVLLTVETRDAAHHDAVVAQLRSEGFNVAPRN